MPADLAAGSRASLLEAFHAGFSPAELADRRAQIEAWSARVLVANRDVLDGVVARSWRLLTVYWVPICRVLDAFGVGRSGVRRVKRTLEYPVHSFHWCRSLVEGPGRSYLGDGRALAADVIWFFTHVEGQTSKEGLDLPFDLVECYLLACTLDRVLSLEPEQVNQVLDEVFGRAVPNAGGGSAALRAALDAFVRFRRHEGVASSSPEADAFGAASVSSDVSVGSASIGRVSEPARAWRTWRRLESAGVFLALLVGLPLRAPFRSLASDERVLGRRARWLGAFLRERPRSNNTPGSHLACGIIAVKRSVKELALRRERADGAIAQGERRRLELVRERNRAAERVYASLIVGHPDAVEHSRQAAECERELDRLDADLLARRLAIQSVVLQAFGAAWDEERRSGRVDAAGHERVRAELAQPADEPPALLPLGLVRSRAVWVFEYGMLLGRLALAIAFVATFRVSYLAWAVGLFLLNAYVIEPVVFKLQMSALGRFLVSPGHKLLDLRRYIQSELPEDAVFRVPITVPKFSSNPAWTNLNAIIQAALTRSLTTSFTIAPFALRRGVKHVQIELGDGTDTDVAARAEALCQALALELELGRAKFPLATRVSREGRRVTVALTDEDDAIWALIGEDASQAFIYMWRNLRGLRDTLSYLGPKFQPVFILASNTEDADAVEYELAEIRKLQAWSEREYGGQVGFLYLLRGGAWFNFNSRLERFDEKDKIFARAVGHFKERLSDPETPAREQVLAALIRTLEPRQLATAFNALLEDPAFYEAFADVRFERLPRHAVPPDATLALLGRRRAGEALSGEEQRRLNRELLLTALPMRARGAFFKKVGNDIAVQELLVAGKTRPQSYLDRRVQEHVQDPELPNYARVWGDFSRYTGLCGTTPEIEAAILRGDDVPVASVPELGAILDDKNEFSPGEIEKGLATLLHPENRHIVIGVPRIDVTLPEHEGHTVASEYILAAQAARAAHNAKDALTRVRIFSMSSPAYGKWFERPKPYLAHYARESLNAAHALSHDFQQSYLVAGAAGRLGGFTEALYGPARFEVRAALQPETRERTPAAPLAGPLAAHERRGSLPARLWRALARAGLRPRALGAGGRTR